MADIKIVCPETKRPLVKKNTAYVNEDSSNEISYQIINHIPRFIDTESYAGAFGYQWRVFQKTQLDSYTKVNYSQSRLERVLGAEANTLAGKTVLEVGCGAGRFTEVFLNKKAKVYSTDLSSAVEANYSNFSEKHSYFLAQADLYKLPFEYGSFDYVFCLGVLQHTPDSEKSIKELSRYLKPSGTLLIDHYKTITNSNKKVRFRFLKNLVNTNYLLREILLGRNPKTTVRVTKVVTDLFWPLHVFANYLRRKQFLTFLSKILLRISPLFDYHITFSELDSKIMKEWMWLDLHDSVTDQYKSLKDKGQILEYLNNANLENIHVWEDGNGIEARATKRTTS